MPQPLPDADTIRRVAREVLEQSDYDLAPPERTSWLGEWGTHILDKLLAVSSWLRRVLAMLPDWLQWVLLFVLIVIVVWGLQRTFLHWRRTGRLHALIPSNSLATSLSPEEWDRRAEEAAQREDFVNAARLHLRAAVLRIENAEQRINRPGTTNIELLRRYRGTRISASLGVLVGTVNLKWYGGRHCTLEEYDRCLQAAAAIRQNPRPTPVVRRPVTQ